MNLHHLTFKEILDLCASLESAADIDDMIESLVLLEKNIRYLRTALAGKKLQDTLKQTNARRQRRESEKQHLRIVSSSSTEDKKKES